MNRIDPNQMSFWEHLEELRSRIIKSLFLWVVVFVVCFAYVKPIFNFLAQPLIALTEAPHFAAFDPKEPFYAHLRASVWVSVFFSSGIFFYQLWAFVAPGLTKKERNFAIPFLFFMAFFFLAGCLFSFLQLFPAVLNFLVDWNADGQDVFTRTKYLGILIGFVLGCGISFEMPLVIYFFARIGLVTPKMLLAHFKWAILLVFILAAIITPTPDPYTQTLLAGPMVCLYLLGVAMAATVKRPSEEADAEEEEPPTLAKLD